MTSAGSPLAHRVFGAAPAGVVPRGRRAAYALILDADGRVATVRGAGGMHWLPGGGAEDGETAEATVLREIREELGRGAQLGDRIATAVQRFHAADDGCWYEMAAVFLRAELGDISGSRAEYVLHWLDPAREGDRFFHASHAWAAMLARGGHDAEAGR